MTTHETDPELPVSVQEVSSRSMVGGTESSIAWDLLKEVSIVIIQFNAVQSFSRVQHFATP